MILRRTVLPGETPPFLMELPDYRFPSLRVVFSRVWEQCWAFVRGAGTLILAVTVVLWALAYFPHPEQLEADVRAQYAPQLEELVRERQVAAADPMRRMRGKPCPMRTGKSVARNSRREIENHIAGAYMEQSWLGRLGKLIAPVVRPLGWDWRIGCAVVASFPAREVVIGAMGVIYNLGEGQSEESLSLKEELRRQVWPGTNRPVFTVPVALSIMVFFSLCAQCAATLSTIYLETRELALACVRVCVHDMSRLFRCAADISGGDLAGWMNDRARRGEVARMSTGIAMRSLRSVIVNRVI